MPEYLADTMAIISHLADRGLGTQADQIFLRADENKETIFISTISLMEILYLSEKQRINLKVTETISYISNSANYEILPLTAEIILTAATINDVRELHDRIIAATAKHHQLPIITNDPVLQSSKHISTIW